MALCVSGVYYCFNIAVVIVSIFVSSIVSKVESCQDVLKLKRVPPLARKVLLLHFVVSVIGLDRFLKYALARCGLKFLRSKGWIISDLSRRCCQTRVHS